MLFGEHGADEAVANTKPSDALTRSIGIVIPRVRWTEICSPRPNAPPTARSTHIRVIADHVE